MDLFTIYKIGISVLIPVFSAITCGTLVALSLRDCLTIEEKKLKRILLVYLLLSGTGWYMAFCYEFHPQLFAVLHVVCLLSFVLPSIFFYRIVRFLTRLGQPEKFSPVHYLIPGLLTVTMLIWSLFVPLEIQTEIVKGKAQIYPQDYLIYTHFFTLKPLLRVVFGMVYYILTIAILLRYYKKARGNHSLVRNPASWVVFLLCISIASLLSSLLPTFKPRSDILHSFWTLVSACAIAIQHILLSYHIIRRKYRLYAVREINSGKERHLRTQTAAFMENDTERRRRQYNGKLTRNRFESYFRDEKPYLNPSCKIADLVEAFDVNRTVISSFINRTYGMNFNRYMNTWRLKELEKLLALPVNQGKSVSSLINRCGFDNYRTYLRAAANERQEKQESPEKRKEAHHDKP